MEKCLLCGSKLPGTRANPDRFGIIQFLLSAVNRVRAESGRHGWGGRASGASRWDRRSYGVCAGEQVHSSGRLCKGRREPTTLSTMQTAGPACPSDRPGHRSGSHRSISLQHLRGESTSSRRDIQAAFSPCGGCRRLRLRSLRGFGTRLARGAGALRCTNRTLVLCNFHDVSSLKPT